jgi:hypothetical protein
MDLLRQFVLFGIVHYLFIPKELMKCSSIAQEKLAPTRRELQEIDHSHFTKLSGTIFNCFSRTQSGEEQDIRNQTHNTGRVNFNKQD